MSNVDTARIVLRLPSAFVGQLDEWSDQAGLKRGQYASVALAIGARVLASQLALEGSMADIPAVEEVKGKYGQLKVK